MRIFHRRPRVATFPIGEEIQREILWNTPRCGRAPTRALNWVKRNQRHITDRPVVWHEPGRTSISSSRRTGRSLRSVCGPRIGRVRKDSPPRRNRGPGVGLTRVTLPVPAGAVPSDPWQRLFELDSRRFDGIGPASAGRPVGDPGFG